jgi:hypothetical protein
MEAAQRIGPISLCAVITTDLEFSSNAYAQVMGMTRGERFSLDATTAEALGLADAAHAPARLLTGASGRRWLLQIEAPGAAARDALATYGWMAQEVLVEDVDALAATLESTPFTLLRPPRELDVDNTIRACQALGPDGEILYLTQVNGQMPGSELPENAQGVDHLFIAVLSSPDREASIDEYAALSGGAVTKFDTRLSCVNQHRGWDLEERHPIATVQFAGRCLVEIDQIRDTEKPATGLCAGTATICIEAAGAAPPEALRPAEGPLAGYAVQPRTGIAGERIALLYSAGN